LFGFGLGCTAVGGDGRNISDVRHSVVGRGLVSRRSNAKELMNDSANKLHKSRLMRYENRKFLRLTFIFMKSFDGGTRGPALPSLYNFLRHISLCGGMGKYKPAAPPHDPE